MLLGLYWELIGVDICNEVNTSEESKHTMFHSLEPLITFSDLPMFLRIFWFYALWIPFFEVRVLPWQRFLKQGHGGGAGGGSPTLDHLWTVE